jgi:hypothetical protein
MSTKDFTANVISATKVVPDGNFKDSKASGIWDINEALDLIKGGNWPNVANINPAAFVDGLFQTTLWTGTADGSTGAQDITTGIDLANKEGMLWLYNRDNATAPHIFDTIRGANVRLRTDRTTESGSVDDLMDSFNSDGFRLGVGTTFNQSTVKNVGFTFKSKPKFFDIVTYTGTGSAMTIDHNLGSVPGMIIVKSTSAAYDWAVWHREFTGTTDYIKLNTSAAKTDSAGVFGNGSNYLTPTSTQFFVGGNNQVSGEVGGGYVAYLFAHNNDDGGFGEPEDQDIIKCGSYTGNGSNDGPTINLGFEPQWLMIKDADGAENWQIFDNMRGMAVGQYPVHLYPNSAAAEGTIQNQFDINSTGFKITFNSNRTNANGDTYIYMAIRRGGMQTPTAASDVFAIDARTGSTPEYISGFPVDFALIKDSNSSSDWIVNTRLLGNTFMETNTTVAEASDSLAKFDIQNGIRSDAVAGDYGWMWARARGYFDVVAYTGTGSATTVSHNLSVVPEMIWVKQRSGTKEWRVYHKDLDSSAPEDYYVVLNSNNARVDNADTWNDTAPTSSVFSVGSGTVTNQSGQTFIAYLFATIAGVSKVGSFSHTNGSTTDVDCGFTGDTPSFVLLKRYNTTGSWVVFDSTRGIVAGNDPFLKLDAADAETTGNDVIDPLSGGFQVASGFLATGDWIFYAIAATS